MRYTKPLIVTLAVALFAVAGCRDSRYGSIAEHERLEQDPKLLRAEIWYGDEMPGRNDVADDALPSYAQR